MYLQMYHTYRLQIKGRKRGLGFSFGMIFYWVWIYQTNASFYKSTEVQNGLPCVNEPTWKLVEFIVVTLWLTISKRLWWGLFFSERASYIWYCIRHAFDDTNWQTGCPVSYSRYLSFLACHETLHQQKKKPRNPHRASQTVWPALVQRD